VKKIVYVCHRFTGDPAGNVERVRRIAEALKHECVPLVPHLLLPAYVDELTERSLALTHCLRLVAAADEVRVFGEPTAGMRSRSPRRGGLGIPVVFADASSGG